MKFLEIKNKISEILLKQKSLDGLNNRIEITEEWCSELEYRSIDTTLSDEHRVKTKKKSSGPHWPVGQYQKV